jgi:hypothetical protein
LVSFFVFCFIFYHYLFHQYPKSAKKYLALFEGFGIDEKCRNSKLFHLVLVVFCIHSSSLSRFIFITDNTDELVFNEEEITKLQDMMHLIRDLCTELHIPFLNPNTGKPC